MSIFEENMFNLLVILGFIVIHLSSKYFFLERVNLDFMMSFAAGVGDSYAIIHLLPQLAYSQVRMIKQLGWDSGTSTTTLFMR